MTWINEWLGHDRLCHVSHVSMLQRKRDRTGLQSKKTTKVNWSRYCGHNPKMPFSAWSNEEVISNTESAYVTSLKIIRRELQSGKKKDILPSWRCRWPHLYIWNNLFEFVQSFVAPSRPRYSDDEQWVCQSWLSCAVWTTSEWLWADNKQKTINNTV